MVGYNQRETAHALLEQGTYLTQLRSAGKDVSAFCLVAVFDMDERADTKINNRVFVRRDKLLLCQRMKARRNERNGVALPAFLWSLEREAVVGVQLRVLLSFVHCFYHFGRKAAEVGLEIVVFNPVFGDGIALRTPLVQRRGTVVVYDGLAIQGDVADLAFMHW